MLNLLLTAALYVMPLTNVQIQSYRLDVLARCSNAPNKCKPNKKNVEYILIKLDKFDCYHVHQLKNHVFDTLKSQHKFNYNFKSDECGVHILDTNPSVIYQVV